MLILMVSNFNFFFNILSKLVNLYLKEGNNIPAVNSRVLYVVGLKIEFNNFPLKESNHMLFALYCLTTK